MMLPNELLTIVSSLVGHADLSNLALTSKRFCDIATPLLYSDIDLHSYTSARKCLIKLTMAPTGDDVARYVKSFRLRVNCFVFDSEDDVELLGRELARCIARMVNLRKLQCGSYVLASLERALVEVLSTPHPKLELVDLACKSDVSAQLHDSFNNIDLCQFVPNLRSLILFSPPGTWTPHIQVLKSLLPRFSSNLEELYLSIRLLYLFHKVTQSNSSFPSLRSLHLDAEVLCEPYYPVLTAFTHVRSLCVRETLRTNPGLDDSLSLTAFPALEELECPNEQIALFLHPHNPTPRPIHTIALDGASYERNGGNFIQEAPGWQTIIDAASLFQYSAVPIKDLRFYVTRLDIRSLQSTVSTFAKLESLLMIFDDEPKKNALLELGTVVLAHLPCLRTLLISDATLKFHDWHARFWFARDLGMQRALLDEYLKYSPGLQRVAFTTEFEWERATDGWWYTTEQVDAEVNEEPEDDPDEESDSNSSMDDDEDGDDDMEDE